MNYITHKRFKENAICGQVNIPAMTVCPVVDNFIMYNGKTLCSIYSENAHLYFAINDDNRGMQRGNLTSRITKKLQTIDNDYQRRWDKVWDDKFCEKYKRPEHSDHWLWSHAFFNADIDSLTYIANLVGA